MMVFSLDFKQKALLFIAFKYPQGNSNPRYLREREVS